MRIKGNGIRIIKAPKSERMEKRAETREAKRLERLEKKNKISEAPAPPPTNPSVTPPLPQPPLSPTTQAPPASTASGYQKKTRILDSFDPSVRVRTIDSLRFRPTDESTRGSADMKELLLKFRATPLSQGVEYASGLRSFLENATQASPSATAEDLVDLINQLDTNTKSLRKF